MAYTGHKYDIFISYAQADNEPFDPDNKKSRWITRLHDDIVRELTRALGSRDELKLEIFLDEQGGIGGNEPLSKTIQTAVDDSAVLLVVSIALGRGFRPRLGAAFGILSANAL